MTDALPRQRTRRRWVLAALVTPTVIAGLVMHRFGSGTAADVGGDALYAVMVYLLAACLLSAVPRAVPAAVAVAICTGIELLQLTGLPALWASMFAPAALVFGTGFDVRDLIVYAVAAVVAAAGDALLSRRLAARAP